MFNKNIFNVDTHKIPDDVEIVFVADMFVENYVGGAELTTQALIDSSPFKIFKILSSKLSMQLLESGHKKFWIFGNFSQVNHELIPSIVANLDYAVLEYDYKYCVWRSAEKHKSTTGEDCSCRDSIHGKMISAFMYGAKSLWWMSERQMEYYHKMYPFLKERENTVLSSVFDDNFFAFIKLLREKYTTVERKGWIVLGSTSWIKGLHQAEEWCKKNKKQCEIVWDLPYKDLLEKLVQAEGFVYIPQGGDTCPRMVIEAKLLGCKLHLNDNVEHAKEIWFEADDMFDTEAYLYSSREKFWNGIKHNMEWKPTLSGYTTTLNCIKHGYPWKQSIKSMLGMCTEVIVVDGGSDDGTWRELQEWASVEEKLNAFKIDRDWSHPRFAVFDGMQKAEARKRCTGEFCWQQDADEIIHENDYEKITSLLRAFPAQIDIVCLPVVEYWGAKGKVRVDVNPWKWRISRNKENITHGIPTQFRRFDKNGDVYAALGTDGCDYIDKETGVALATATFYNDQAHNLRVNALENNEEALKMYAEWFNRCVEMLPGVHHYSWRDLPRKIKTYKDYWSQHWQSLYDIKQEDSPENNMFFQKSWSEVSHDDIEKLACDLEEKMGGWIFHDPVDFSKPTPWLKLDVGQPSVMLEKDE